MRGSQQQTQKKEIKKYVIASSAKCYTKKNLKCSGREQRVTRGRLFTVVETGLTGKVTSKNEEKEQTIQKIEVQGYYR